MKAALVLLLLAGGASAGEVVSKGADQVSATLYQSYRGLPDVALIVETRTVDLPAGDSILRFDRVASTLIPATAQVSGLAEPARESDFDFDLFDAATILRKSIGEKVDLVEYSAKAPEAHHRGTLLADEGVITLKGEEGIENFGCGGPAARLEVPVPKGLRAVPSLSVRIHGDRPETRVIHLAYLAGNLRWHAAYVAKVAADRHHIALTGRIILDNDTATGFEDVPTRFVAGDVNRTYGTQAPRITAGPVRHDCWPRARTTDPVGWDPGLDYLKRMTAAVKILPGAQGEYAMNAVTMPAPASAPSVTLEKLGDLKLYRLSEPLRIAARQRKFFDFAAFPKVEAEPAFNVSYPVSATVEGGSAQLVWHFRDKAERGLGKPLPKGAVTFYGGDGIYWGDDSLTSDVAEGEEFDLKGPPLGEVTFDHWLTREEHRQNSVERSHVLMLRNNLAEPATVEIPHAAGGKLTLGAHETRRLTYDTSDRF